MPEIIRSIRLEATSIRNAWYELRVLKFADGYVVEKKSGVEGSKGLTESYYRSSLPEAEEKFFSILNAKIRGNSRRKYRRVGVPSGISQMPLFTTA